MAIHDEDGNALPTGTAGEIVKQSPTGMQGYYKNAEASAKALKGGWLYTGDLGYLDADGYLYFVDRVKDMVRRGDENISSEEVERVLNSHPQVAESAVIAVPDPLRRGVGIMLINSAGHAFVPQRSDMTDEAWQMPQGGIEPDETPRAAALRELREELGTANVEVVVGTEDWLSYELPRELLDRMPTPRWTGQTQQWFLMRFRGTDDEINVATEHPEFSTWKWVPPDQLLKLIVPFKRELYRRVLLEFAP